MRSYFLCNHFGICNECNIQPFSLQKPDFLAKVGLFNCTMTIVKILDTDKSEYFIAVRMNVEKTHCVEKELLANYD